MGPGHMVRGGDGRKLRISRGLAVFGVLTLAFGVIAGQLVRLAVMGQAEISLSLTEPLTKSFARPDIIDRKGRLVATDLEVPSLFADPALLLDVDEAIEKLRAVLPDLDEAELGRTLRDSSRRFVWIRRGLLPELAQRIHNLGLPGLGFRTELRRAYPLGRLAGHVLGGVNIDNKGLSGIERHIDETAGIEAVLGTRADLPPVQLTLDIGVQHSLEAELNAAIVRYQARGAAGLIIDAGSGAVVAAASLPDVDPARPSEALQEERANKLAAGTFELGSIFKLLTVAMAIDSGRVRLDTLYDVREALTVGRFTIRDLHPQGRPLSVAEIFLHSSNVGAGMLALEAGGKAQQVFLARLGLLERTSVEAGPIAPPQVPQHWDKAETITISYGHGLAVAPIQFAAATAALMNGGLAVTPTFVWRRSDAPGTVRERVVSEATSKRLRELMRLNVTHPAGTGRRADVPGYEVGGKTGTAEMPVKGGYEEKAVISSFVAAFPTSAPRYVVLVMLFEPTGSAETRNQITAGVNAAPTAGRIIARAAPLLGVLPVMPGRP